MSADSPASILFDQNGNPVSVVYDGTYYRIKVDAKIDTVVIVNITATATRTTVEATTSDVLLLVANTSRIGAFIYNNSDAALLLGLGPVPVSTSDFMNLIPAQSGFEIPFNFTGELRGIWLAATGEAYITELT